MAVTLNTTNVAGNLHLVTGTFTTTGNLSIKTGLQSIQHWSATASTTSLSVFNGTVSGGTITLLSASAETGTIMVLGI